MFFLSRPTSIKALKSHRRILYGGMTLVILAAVLAAVVTLMHLRKETNKRIITTTQYLNNSVEQTLVGMIDGIDFALQVSAEEINRQIASGHPDEDFINHFLKKQQQRLPYLDLLRVANEKGEAIYGQGVVKAARVSLSHREYFKQLRNDPSIGMVIAEPIIGAISQQWIWLMARRIDQPDGSFGGLVYASIFIDEIVRMFDQIKMSPGSVIALLDHEMRLVARTTFNSSTPLPIGKTTMSPAFAEAFRLNPLEGTFDTGDHSLDGVHRLYCYRRNPKYGFMVQVGSPMSDITAQWQRQAMIVIEVLAAFMLAALTFARSLGRSWQRQEDDIATLETAVAERTSQLNEQRQTLNELYNRHELATTAGNIGIWDWYVPENRLVWDDRMFRLYGTRPAEFSGGYDAWKNALHPDDQASCEHALRSALAGEQSFCIEFKVIWPDASIHHLFGTATVKRDENGTPLRMTGINYDITEQKQAHERIEFLAFHDTLTGLPNRHLAQDRLQQGLAVANRHHTMLAVLYLDLVKFKYVNDTHGYTVGDLLLKKVAKRLSSCLRAEDTLCHLAGDRFMVVLPDVKLLNQVSNACERILAHIAEPFDVEGIRLVTLFCIGVAVAPQDGADSETLMRNADTALHEAKKGRQGSYRFFEQQMKTNLEHYIQTRNALHLALERHEFELYYQPQIELRSGRVVGVEALLRWNRPGHGVAMPGSFIGIAEESGLILAIGRWALREACRQAAVWQTSGGRNLAMAVNLSALQFRVGTLEEDVIAALADSGLNPSLLELELTESTLLECDKTIMSTIARWKAAGIRLAIDDFGTGYSSLAYLKHFNLDKLKIDRSFIVDLQHDDDSRAILLAVIQIAQALKLTTVAEGVEDMALVDQLKAMGCDLIQGYLYSRPLAAPAFEQWLENYCDRAEWP
jgi:diguanylate cyclase (GGDEF)-like protein